MLYTYSRRIVGFYTGYKMKYLVLFECDLGDCDLGEGNVVYVKQFVNDEDIDILINQFYVFKQFFKKYESTQSSNINLSGIFNFIDNLCDSNSGWNEFSFEELSTLHDFIYLNFEDSHINSFRKILNVEIYNLT